jgi:hypothetical protein
MQADVGATTLATDTVCRRGSAALLALRTRYGLETVNIAAMDRITALRVAATLEFLRNNLPEETP